VTLIGINRPDVRNCVNATTSAELSAAIENFENDQESPIAVLYGVGGNFCAGYDLKELALDKDNVSNILMRSEGAMVSIYTLTIGFYYS
jgi:enoyl-CoA hydratase/carnithine racemase